VRLVSHTYCLWQTLHSRAYIRFFVWHDRDLLGLEPLNGGSLYVCLVTVHLMNAWFAGFGQFLQICVPAWHLFNSPL
jgi:hypothetical protein